MGIQRETNPPLGIEVPFGKENRTKIKKREHFNNRFLEGFSAEVENKKILPPKPTQADRRRIITAKLRELTIKEFVEKGDRLYIKNLDNKRKGTIGKIATAKLQKLAGGYNDVIKSFMEKKPNKSGNYSTDGKNLYLFKNKIAEHSSTGLRVSNAGYDTQTTYKALIGLGVDVSMKGGETHINNKPYKHGAFVTIPYNKLKENPGENNILDTSRRRDTNEDLVKMRSLRNRVMNKSNILSQTVTQPADQRKINTITGVKSPIPKTTRATAMHHILYRRNAPGLQFNVNNVIPLDRRSHSEVHRFDRMLAGQLKLARQMVAERKMDIEHKHTFSFYKVAKQLDARAPELVEEPDGKYWKYWLLNAKQVNGNGWGVVQETIGQHIGRFKGRPFTITSNEWIENSEYGARYEHPFLPTNHLPTIFAHQAKFEIGGITRVFKDDNDDYYAMIKPLEKFANRTPPPFCSPGIFQLDPRERENHLTQWEPLHLAGLDTDPAYGAHVALLKGTCVGTPEACIIQFGAQQKVAKGVSKTQPFEPTKNFIDINEDPEHPPKSQASINAIKARRKRMGFTARIICPTKMKGEIMKMRLAEMLPKHLRDKAEQYRKYMVEERGVPAWKKSTQKELLSESYKNDEYAKTVKAKLAALTIPARPKRVKRLHDYPMGQEIKDRLERITEIRGKSNQTEGDRRELADHETQVKYYTDKYGATPTKPTQKDRIRALQSKMAALRSTSNSAVNKVNILGLKKKKRQMYAKLHPGAEEVLKHLHEPSNGNILSSSYIDQNGKILMANGNHYYDTRELGGFVGLKMKNEDDPLLRPSVDDSTVHEFIKRTGLVRLQHFPEIQKMSFHIAEQLTIPQIRTIRELSKQDPNLNIGHAIGSNYNDLDIGEGEFRDLISAHRKQFGQKLAQAEGETNVFNMTYSKSKPFRRLKKKIQTAKLQQLFAAASRYNINPPSAVKINPEHGRIIAEEYDKLKHDPENPEVKEAYGSLIKETNQQFKDLLSGGLTIDQIKPGEIPYPSSKEMHEDVEKNNHLYYFPTEQGYGSGGKGHPLLQPTEFKQGEKPMLANDVFRIVHDINGHHLAGNSGFGPKGEHQAFLQHKKIFSPLAQKALFTETAGQNNWVNFSKKYGEFNRKNPKNTIYAEQKAALFPNNILEAIFHNES